MTSRELVLDAAERHYRNLRDSADDYDHLALKHPELVEVARSYRRDLVDPLRKALDEAKAAHP